MTDQQLALALRDVSAVAGLARATWADAHGEHDERKSALMVVRNASATKMAIEQWILARTLRAQLDIAQ